VLPNRRQNLIVLPGDGIGPEVIRQAVRVVDWFAKHRGFDCDIRHEAFGAGAYHRTGAFLKEEVLADMMTADAVLFGAMGGAIDAEVVPADIRRQFGLLRVRKEMGLFANLRPVKPFAALADASSLRPEVTRGVDLVVVRELIGGIYFGTPRGIETLPDGQRRGVNTQVYTTSEIRRIGKAAFELARSRHRRVTSVDKANVLEVSQLWRETVTRVGQDYPDVRLDHLYVDTAAMRLVADPRAFDVLLTENMFGDILSDEAAVLVGSLGLLPSASLGEGPGLFEPIHGSAPDIAGGDVANPIGAIATVALLLRHGLGLAEPAAAVERAISSALEQGARTRDIAEPAAPALGTRAMGSRIAGLIAEAHRSSASVAR